MAVLRAIVLECQNSEGYVDLSRQASPSLLVKGADVTDPRARVLRQNLAWQCPNIEGERIYYSNQATLRTMGPTLLFSQSRLEPRRINSLSTTLTIIKMNASARRKVLELTNLTGSVTRFFEAQFNVSVFVRLRRVQVIHKTIENTFLQKLCRRRRDVCTPLVSTMDRKATGLLSITAVSEVIEVTSS